MRHVDWCSIRFTPTSDPDAASALIPHGRLMLGDMIEGLKLVGQRTGTLRRELADGSTIVVSFDGVTPLITIDTPTTEESSVDGAAFNLWVPRGLVVYPAWSDAPYGVGLPIIPDADEKKGPYDATNLAPGLARARWTAGGPCGEVLISADKNAGYPGQSRDIVVPLLYDATKGPVFRWNGKGSYDARPAKAAWTPYRMELAKPSAYYPDESAPNAQAMFESINAYRIHVGQLALNLTPRGYYGAARVAVSIMQAAGTDAETSPSYPPTYRTTADRLTKDGYSAEIAYGPYTSWNRGDNPTAFELAAVGGTPTSLLTEWKADPGSNTILTLDVGRAAFSNVGFRGGYWCVNVISRTRWIEAGNCHWQSADPELPPVSWHGFASVNLAWETYPAIIGGGADGSTPTLTPLYAFTTQYGDCWLNYPRNPDPAREDVDPAMGRHIYMRGRSIATAPRGGLVWGACLQPHSTTDDAGKVTQADRLIALVHHPEDQPGDYTTNGWTRYLRVWWCDIPRRPYLRADPQQTICGEDATDTWGWKGGQLLDVGHMPAPINGHIEDGVTSSLKYASQWKFNKAGTKAVCMRDYGLYSDYASTLTAYVLNETNGLRPRTVELLFNTVAADTTATVVFYPYNSIGPYPGFREIAAPLDTSDVINDPHIYEYRLFDPVAVDYGAQDELIYARGGYISNSVESADVTFYYLGTGPDSAVWPSELQNRVLWGLKRKSATSDFSPFGPFMVADVITGAFVSEGVRPKYTFNGDTWIGHPPSTNSACYPFTGALVHGVRMWRNGQLLDESWYAAPDGLVISVVDSCIDRSDPEHPNGLGITWLPLAMSLRVQVFLAENMGASVFSTQVSPVPLAARFLDSPPISDDCGCMQTTQQIIQASHQMTYDELNPRGGRAIANVPLPSNDWLIYAKVV